MFTDLFEFNLLRNLLYQSYFLQYFNCCLGFMADRDSRLVLVPCPLLPCDRTTILLGVDLNVFKGIFKSKQFLPVLS